MHVGLITGLGPAATVVYYQRLTQIAADRDHRLELTMVEANIREVMANNIAGRAQDQAEVFAILLHRLKAAGADFASITAIGPNFCWEETKSLSPLPLVSSIQPLDLCCEARGCGTVGLLGTSRAMHTKLFGQMIRTRVLLPADIDRVGKAYQDMAVEGQCSEDTRKVLFDAGQEMMQEGADVVALAGTDLLLAFDGRDPGFPVVDALEAHAALLADLATDRAPIPQTP